MKETVPPRQVTKERVGEPSDEVAKEGEAPVSSLRSLEILSATQEAAFLMVWALSRLDYMDHPPPSGSPLDNRDKRRVLAESVAAVLRKGHRLDLRQDWHKLRCPQASDVGARGGT